MSGLRLDLGGLIGEPCDSVVRRFGAPAADRTTGEDRWMVFVGPGWSLRLRARREPAGETARVSSWTIGLDPGFSTLSAAASALGLAIPPPSGNASPLRAALPDPRTGETYSLTAVERGGLVRSITAFDEPPEWDPVAAP